MNDKHLIVAFMATLLSIVTLVITGSVIAMQGRSTEALGIGAAVTGLIGVIGTFKPRGSTTPEGTQDVNLVSSSGPQDVNVVNTPSRPQDVHVVNPVDDPAHVEVTK